MADGMPAVPFPIAEGIIPAPIDQSLIQAAQNAGLGPILNTPASEFLSKAGLPPLPEIPPLPPLPGMPPLPVLNLEQLFKPLTDLAGSFGSGDLGASGFDPTTIFSTLSQVLSSTVGMSTSALKSLDGLWQGVAGATSAAKTTTSAAESTAAATKAAAIVTNTQGGAATVGVGKLEMNVVISKFMATATTIVSTGLIATPVGQGALITAALLALSEGTAVVTQTKATLSPLTAAQQANAIQAGITAAPKSLSPFSLASSLIEGVTSPISTLASTGSSALGQLAKQNASTNKNLKNAGKSDKAKEAAKKAAAAAAKKAGAGGKGGGGKGGGGGGAPATPLQPRPGVGGVGASLDGASNTSGMRSTTTSSMTGGGMMPMGMGGAGAAAAAGRGGAGDDGHGSPDFLVTSDHGSAVVGSIPDVTPAVIGDEDYLDTTDGSPDVELRL